MDALLRMFSNMMGGNQKLVSPRVEDNPGQFQVTEVSDPNWQMPSQDLTNDPVNEYKGLIASSAKQNGIKPSELAGALARESMQFNPKFVHGYHLDGAGRGIAGIDANQHPEVSDQQAEDPNFAIPWAAQKLGALQKQTGNFYDATRMYNGGNAYNSNRPGYQGIPISQLTKQHADAIQRYAQKYQPLFGDQ